MSKINCNVNNCTHNRNDICYANLIDVCGGKAQNSQETCCASFLNKLNYSTLTSGISTSGDTCDAIICDVSSCSYNDHKHCYADSINVSGRNSSIYKETDCDTFKTT